MVIASAGFPHGYHNHQKEVWNLKSESGFYVSFIAFDTETHYDLVFIINEYYNTTSREIKLSGGIDYIDTYTFNDPFLSIIFKSDGSGTSQGFKAVVTAVSVPLFRKYSHFFTIHVKMK